MQCGRTVNMFTTGRWLQRFLHSQTTQPASPTLIPPTKMLSRTTTQASLVLYSSASLASSKIYVLTYAWWENPKTSGAPTPDVLSCSFYWRLSSSLSLQAVWMSQERRSASTMSTCSSLEFLMRKRASTNQTAMPRTSMSSTPSTDSQRDHYLVSEWVIQLYRWYFQTSYDFDVLGIPLPFLATFTQLNYRRKYNFQLIIQSITSDKIVKLSTVSWNPWWYLQMAWRQILTLEKLD